MVCVQLEKRAGWLGRLYVDMNPGDFSGWERHKQIGVLNSLWSAEQSLPVRSTLRAIHGAVLCVCVFVFVLLIQRINPLPKVLCLFSGSVYPRTEVCKLWPTGHIWSPTCFINKEHILVISLRSPLWLSHCGFHTVADHKAELSSSNIDCMTCKVWDIRDLILYRKTVLTLALWFSEVYANFPIRLETLEIILKVCLITLCTAHLCL